MAFKKGDPRINRKGRPKGTKNFSTIVDETIAEIAKVNGITVKEAWQYLIQKQYAEAKKGNYPFFKDLMDRYYGKAVQKMELSGPDGEPLIDPETRAKANRLIDGLLGHANHKRNQKNPRK